jgi:hypothetical protein
VSPSVCVALAVRNGERYLAAAMESVLAQQEVELTLHVIDNCSTDASIQIARRYEEDPRVQVTVNEEDLRYYGSLNRALEATEADYFVPFACDDLMLPGNLSRKVDILARTDAALVHSTSLWMDELGALSGPVIDHRLTPPLAEAPYFFPQLVPNNRVNCPSAVVSVRALRSIGGFDARDDFAADWLAWLRLSLRHSVATLTEPLIGYRRHPDSGTSHAERTGLRGMYEPATLQHALGDPRCPESWGTWRDRLMAATLSLVASGLHDQGHRRAGQGWAAYPLLLRALARSGGLGDEVARLQAALAAAGLAMPVLPLEAVALGVESADDAQALGEVTAELAPVLDRLFIPVDPERAQDTLGLLEPVFGDVGFDAVIVPALDVDQLCRPGRISLARWGSGWVERSEAAGVPVLPIAAPDPFAVPPDPERWETLPQASPAALGFRERADALR